MKQNIPQITIWAVCPNGFLQSIEANINMPGPDYCTQALEEFPIDTPQSVIDERLRAIRAMTEEELIATYY